MPSTDPRNPSHQPPIAPPSLVSKAVSMDSIRSRKELMKISFVMDSHHMNTSVGIRTSFRLFYPAPLPSTPKGCVYQILTRAFTPRKWDVTFSHTSAPRMCVGCRRHLPAGRSNHQTDRHTNRWTDLCDLCRGRHPWSQDGRAVICSPWWLEDEERGGKEGRKGRKGGKRGRRMRGAERSEELRRGGK